VGYKGLKERIVIGTLKLIYVGGEIAKYLKNEIFVKGVVQKSKWVLRKTMPVFMCKVPWWGNKGGDLSGVYRKLVIRLLDYALRIRSKLMEDEYGGLRAIVPRVSHVFLSQ